MPVALVPRNLESRYLPFPCLSCLTFYLCSSSPGNGVNLGSMSMSLHTSDIMFAV